MRDWADQKVAVGAVPPWTQYQYTKLREAVDAILVGMDSVRAVTTRVASPDGEQRRGIGHLRLVDKCPSAQSDLADDWYLCPCDVERAP